MKRVTIFLNGFRDEGRCVGLPVSATLTDVLQIIGTKLGVGATRLYTKQGGFIDDVNLIRDDDVLIVSQGEPFCSNHDNSLPATVPLGPSEPLNTLPTKPILSTTCSASNSDSLDRRRHASLSTFKPLVSTYNLRTSSDAGWIRSNSRLSDPSLHSPGVRDCGTDNSLSMCSKSPRSFRISLPVSLNTNLENNLEEKPVMARAVDNVTEALASLPAREGPAEVEEDATELEEDKNVNLPGDWLQINVGGKLFTTTRSTLTNKEPNSMLARMFAADHSADASWHSSLDPSGAFLIDRSPLHFEPLLNYLRHGQLVLDKTVSPQGVLEEARFFGLVSVVEALEEAVAAETEACSPDAPFNRRDVANALMASSVVSELRFQGINFTGADLSKLDLRHVNLKFAKLTSCDLRGANLAYCNLESDIRGLKLFGAPIGILFNSMLNCDLRDLRGLTYQSAIWMVPLCSGLKWFVLFVRGLPCGVVTLKTLQALELTWKEQISRV